MTRTTIALPDELALIVRDEAKRRSTSVSEVVRDALTDKLVGTGRRRVGFAAICNDARLPTGARLEDELERTWSDDLDRRRAQRSNTRRSPSSSRQRQYFEFRSPPF